MSIIHNLYVHCIGPEFGSVRHDYVMSDYTCGMVHGSPQCSTLPLVWMQCDEETLTAGGSGAQRGPEAASAAVSTQSERL